MVGRKAERMAWSSTKPRSCAAESMVSSSTAQRAMGFSHRTCLPPRSISRVCSQCRALGLAM